MRLTNLLCLLLLAAPLGATGIAQDAKPHHFYRSGWFWAGEAVIVSVAVLDGTSSIRAQRNGGTETGLVAGALAGPHPSSGQYLGYLSSKPASAPDSTSLAGDSCRATTHARGVPPGSGIRR